MSRYVVLLMLILGLGLFQLGLAEGEMEVGVEANLALPTGDFGDAAGTGFGGTAVFLYQLNPNVALTGHAGYIKFGEEVEGVDWSAIPILGGARYYIPMEGSNMKPYVGGQLGFHRFSVDFAVDGGFDVGGDETEFSFAPTVGIEINSIDASAFYMIISDANYIGVRVGYGFPIGQ